MAKARNSVDTRSTRSKKKASTLKKVTARAIQKTARKAAQKTSPKRKGPLPPLVSTGFWLMKSEPEAYSIDDFAHDRTTLWTGVRNYLARNYMMTSMKPGDRFLFYHSNAEVTGAVGIGVVATISQPDPTAQDAASEYHDPKASADHPIWFCAEVNFESKFPRAVTLTEIRSEPRLAKMALLQKGQRLSIQSVTQNEFDLVCEMASR